MSDLTHRAAETAAGGAEALVGIVDLLMRRGLLDPGTVTEAMATIGALQAETPSADRVARSAAAAAITARAKGIEVYRRESPSPIAGASTELAFALGVLDVVEVVVRVLIETDLVARPIFVGMLEHLVARGAGAEGIAADRPKAAAILLNAVKPPSGPALAVIEGGRGAVPPSLG